MADVWLCMVAELCMVCVMSMNYPKTDWIATPQASCTVSVTRGCGGDGSGLGGCENPEWPHQAYIYSDASIFLSTKEKGAQSKHFFLGWELLEGGILIYYFVFVEPNLGLGSGKSLCWLKWVEYILLYLLNGLLFEFCVNTTNVER